MGEGRAPTNLLSSTIGDELVISNNGQSRVFSVSIKAPVRFCGRCDPGRSYKGLKQGHVVRADGLNKAVNQTKWFNVIVDIP